MRTMGTGSAKSEKKRKSIWSQVSTRELTNVVCYDSELMWLHCLQPIIIDIYWLVERRPGECYRRTARPRTYTRNFYIASFFFHFSYQRSALFGIFRAKSRCGRSARGSERSSTDYYDWYSNHYYRQQRKREEKGKKKRGKYAIAQFNIISNPHRIQPGVTNILEI